MREPQDDDIQNLKFKRIAQDASAANPVEGEPLEDENPGEGLMRDLEMDMMGDISDDDEAFDTNGRRPPQWTPDRLLSNLVVDAVNMAGVDGIDTASLRDLTTGFFWKRPLESLVTRLTEDWHLNQPLYTRHLAIVRDTTMANDTKRVHYVYRTHEQFQKAVDAGEVTWEALQLEKGKKAKQGQLSPTSVDSLGFHTLNPNDFHKRTGSSTLSEACGSIVRKQRQTRDWESILLNGNGDHRTSATPERATPKMSKKSSSGIESKIPRPLLTQAERIILGLPPKGRLSAQLESQIRAHRKKTGDPNSIPERLVKGVSGEQAEPKPKPRHEKRPGTVNEATLADSEEHSHEDPNPDTLLQSQDAHETVTRDGTSNGNTMMIDNARPTPTPRAGSELCTQEPVTPQYPGDSSSPKRRKGKRTAKEHIQTPRSNKRVRKNLDRPAEESHMSDPNASMQVDGCADAAPLLTTMNQDTHMEQHGQKPSTSRKTLPTSTESRIDLSRSSPGHDAASKEVEKRKSTRRLSEAKPLAKGQKDRNVERLQSGLYLNPNATRPAKGGRGRPRKVFLATFKLPTLHTLSWFVSDSAGVKEVGTLSAVSTVLVDAPTRQSSLPIGNDSPRPPISSDVNETLSTHLDEQVEEQSSLEARAQAHEVGLQSSKSMSVMSSTSTEALALMEIDKLDIAENPSPVQAPESSAAILKTCVIPEKETADVVEPVLGRSHSLFATPRPPPAMSGVTSSNRDSYQSPYAQVPAQTQLEVPNPEGVALAATTGLSNIDTLQRRPSAVVENTSSVNPPWETSKKQKNSTVRVGGGSVSHTRTKLIRHVFDLCDGILPGVDVIYNVFPAIWRELGPKKISCPIDGTIRDAIRAMCPDELVKAPAEIKRDGVPGKKTKTIWYRNHIHGSKVQEAWQKMCEAYPRKYCPPGLLKYWKEEEKPLPIFPKTNKVYFAELYPPASRKLDDRIEQAKRDRKLALKIAKGEQRRLEKQSKIEAKKLAKEQKRQEKLDKSGSRQTLFKKRQRLIGLNDGMQGSASNTALRNIAKTGSLASVSPQDGHLTSMRPALEPPSQINLSHLGAALMKPTIRLHSSSHTFSTDFVVDSRIWIPGLGDSSRKRVRFDAPPDESSHKKLRTSNNDSVLTLPPEIEDDFLTRHHIQIRESSDEEEEDEQDEEDAEDAKPTTAQRLAGLTGDLAQPDFEPRERKKTWTEHQREKQRRRDRLRRSYIEMREERDSKLPETFNALEEFRKLCYTLVIASSMAGENGNVDWNIVSKVYKGVPRFNLQKAKKTWTWIQKKMAQQIQSMADSFQSQFLIAYEEGKVEPIENPATYDWAKLVRWASLNCTYHEPSLPVARESMNDCHFDVSDYNIMDRKVWHNNNLANVGRDERLAKYSFGSPLHKKRKPSMPGNEVEMKARSLVRVTISTPKEKYDKNMAHSKLNEIPEHIINHTVHDFLRASLIKERKVKRQVPGRNYLFSSQFAKKYRRTFELSDFMIAVQLKKDLDAAFTNPDPEKRVYPVDRNAENGVAMAIISMASEGKVRLVPKLPLIKNEFNAPLPRISVWGFSEGEYRHRYLDRRRLFWAMEVVPTDTYQFGNPLRPSGSILDTIDNTDLVEWESLPEPPISTPEQGQNPPLPIWSAIDGQTVTFPWWYRILNIVLQTLLFSPGSTAQDVLARCETYTTELFELQLVLDWLVQVKAAEKSNHDTYELLPSFWAVFGDKLIGEDTDEFGDHVRRQKTNRNLEDTWRMDYNREYNTKTTEGGQGNDTQAGAAQQVFNNVRKQYTIAKHVTTDTGDGATNGQQKGATADRGLDPEQAGPSNASTPGATASTGSPDVDMTDADADADGDDVDAEGESDDEYV